MRPRRVFTSLVLILLFIVGGIGVDPITLLAQEDAAAPSQAPTPANQPPVATDDHAETWSGTTVVFPVVQTDYDPDEQPLTIVELGPTVGGSAWLDGADSIAYQPNSEFSGTEVIAYIISDGELTATANLIVTVLPHPVTETPFPTDTPSTDVLPTDVPPTDTAPADISPIDIPPTDTPPTQEPSPTTTDQPVLSTAVIPVGTLVRPSTSINVRMGAGTSFPSIGIFRSSMTGTITGAPTVAGEREWYPITIPDIGSGYVAGSYLRVVTPTATATPSQTRTPTPGAIPAGSVVRPSVSVNVRTGAGTSFISIGIFRTTMTGTVTGAPVRGGSYDWYPVTIPGIGSGYVAGSYLRIVLGGTTPTRTATTSTGIFSAGDYVITSASVNLRSGPSTSSSVLAVIPKNTSGVITGPGIRGGSYIFYPVSIPGQPAGYIAQNYLRLASAPATATATQTASITASATPTPSPTPSPSPTATATATAPPSSTATEAPSETPTTTQTGTATQSSAPSPTPTTSVTITPTATFAPDDRDGDRVKDDVDNCVDIPNSSQGDVDGDGLGNICDPEPFGPDPDNDGYPNHFDNCDEVANPTQSDADRDRIGDACDEPGDVDADGVMDADDNCAFDPNPDQADVDGDGWGDICDRSPDQPNDEDGDGVDDFIDNCPESDNPLQMDYDGDGIGNACDPQPWLDEDRDLVPDHRSDGGRADNCPGVSNFDQRDSDFDGAGDVCDPSPFGDDRDGDGIPLFLDNCPDVANSDQADSDYDRNGDACDNEYVPDIDRDGIPSERDNCPTMHNPSQLDRDDDGIGDACDPTPFEDRDGDTIEDGFDNCGDAPNTDQKDRDGDRIGDACDPLPFGPDSDGDGQPDLYDNCVSDFNPDQQDFDGTGLEMIPEGGDACDTGLDEGTEYPRAGIRFTLIDQSGSPVEEFSIHATITEYRQDGAVSTFEDELRSFSNGGWAAEWFGNTGYSCDANGRFTPWGAYNCRQNLVIAYELMQGTLAGCQYEGIEGEHALEAGQIRYVVLQTTCSALQIVVVDVNYDKIGGACFNIFNDVSLYGQQCDYDGDGYLVMNNLEPGVYQLVQSGNLTFGSDCVGGRGVVIIGGYDLYRTTARILCGDDIPKPPMQQQCDEERCYLVYSSDATGRMAAIDPSASDALVDLLVGMTCETVGYKVTKLASLTATESFGLGMACGDMASLVQGDSPSARDQAANTLIGLTCAVAGIAGSPAVGALCGLGFYVASNVLTWAMQNDIINTALDEGCYMVPLDSNGRPDFGWHKQAGRGISKDNSWCYSQ